MSRHEHTAPMKLGINGLGRIAKLSVWHHVERKYFSEIFVNIGREVGTRLGGHRPFHREGFHIRGASRLPVRLQGRQG